MKSSSGPWKPYVQQGKSSGMWYPMIIRGRIFKNQSYVELTYKNKYQTWASIEYSMRFDDRSEAEFHAKAAAEQFNAESRKPTKPQPVR